MEAAKDVDTGLTNVVYDLVVLLQQAAEDVVRYEAFAADAEDAGEPELRNWFAELADNDRQIVDRASRELHARLATSTR